MPNELPVMALQGVPGVHEDNARTSRGVLQRAAFGSEARGLMQVSTLPRNQKEDSLPLGLSFVL